MNKRPWISLYFLSCWNCSRLTCTCDFNANHISEVTVKPTKNSISNIQCQKISSFYLLFCNARLPTNSKKGEENCVCLWAGNEVSQTDFLYNFLSRLFTEVCYPYLIWTFLNLLRALFYLSLLNWNAKMSDVMCCVVPTRNLVLLRLPQQKYSCSFVGDWGNLLFQIYISFFVRSAPQIFSVSYVIHCWHFRIPSLMC